MSVVNPRLSVVIEKPLYKAVQQRAKREGVSLSVAARDMLRMAADTDEDIYFNAIAETRERKTGKWLTHEEFWASLV